MVIKPLSLKQIAMNQLYADNHLCNLQVHTNTKINGKPAKITLAPSNENSSFDTTIVLKVDGQETVLQINRAFFSEISIGGVNIGSVFDNLPEEIKQGCIHIIFERTIKDLCSILQKQIEIQSVANGANSLDSFLTVLIEKENTTHQARIGLTEQHQTWLNHLPPVQNKVVPKVPFMATIEAGRTRITTQQLNQLTLLDIIFFDTAWTQESEVFVRIEKNRGFLAKLENHTISLIHALEASMNNESDNELDDDFDDFDDDLESALEENLESSEPAKKEAAQAPQASQPQQSVASAPLDLKNIPVELTFDIGQQELPLANLNQLAPGYTFQLNRPIASPVIIRGNGKPLAEGELVNVNGQIGTKITKML